MLPGAQLIAHLAMSGFPLRTVERFQPFFHHKRPVCTITDKSPLDCDNVATELRCLAGATLSVVEREGSAAKSLFQNTLI